jgi:PTH1 family peptidyl-tRNA hydrolase
MKLIVGLGNPVKEYQNTRHNVGFLVIDALVKSQKPHVESSFDKKSNAEIFSLSLNNEKVLLVKPQTFMNNSGLAVRALVDFYKIPLKNIIIIHDEKDIPLGEYKIQTDRGPAGHNGVKSIIDHLGTKDFTRIRVGVGPKEGGIEKIIDYVLQKFSKEEQRELREVIKKIVEEIVKLSNG